MENSSENRLNHNETDGVKSSNRLMLALRANIELVVSNASNLQVEGRDHLEEVKGKKVILATTHISDIDEQLACYALGQDFDLVLTDQATHHRLPEGSISYLGISLAGKHNFLPINEHHFDSSNFDAMVKAVDAGKTVAMAAHNPTYDGILPKSGGDGVVFLAAKTGAMILPVAVNIEKVGSNPPGLVQDIGQILGNIKNRRRPAASVTIGQPLYPMPIDVDRLGKLLDMRNNHRKLTAVERAELKMLAGQLKLQTRAVMRSLASMLPGEKRGTWGEKRQEQ